ncbi:MAG: hypothetical protein HY747_04705 [Elusimicrobia bacterium]|nr:hypothetical protein [Elusimicrobiota bacterium]
MMNRGNSQEPESSSGQGQSQGSGSGSSRQTGSSGQRSGTSQADNNPAITSDQALEALAWIFGLTVGLPLGLGIAITASIVAGMITDAAFGFIDTSFDSSDLVLDLKKDGFLLTLLKIFGHTFNGLRYVGRVIALLGGPLSLGLGIAFAAGAMPVAIPLAGAIGMIAGGGLLTASGIIQLGLWAHGNVQEKELVSIKQQNSDAAGKIRELQEELRRMGLTQDQINSIPLKPPSRAIPSA